MKNSPGMYIGTTGWSHDIWQGVFYPEGMKKSNYLEHYAAHFPTVEMTGVYYQLPNAKALIEFTRSVPESFQFSVRANRYITDIKRLKDGKLILPPFLTRMDLLGEKMGPVLVQLPPDFTFNQERLQSFLSAIPQDRRWVFEFHHPSWFNDTTYELLAAHNAALGIFQLGEKITPRIPTADFVYLRIVKPKVRGAGKIEGLVNTWKDSLQDWSRSGRDIYCYFYQSGEDCAATDALHFRAGIEDAIGTGQKKGKAKGKLIGLVRAPRRESTGHGEKKTVNWS